MRFVQSALLAILLATGTTQAFGEQQAVPANIDELDRELAAIFKAGRIPGASVAIVQNGQTVFTKGYGFADVDGKIPVTADTPFRAGSISKSITAIAVMGLVEQGKLSLEQTIAQLAPDVPFDNPWEPANPLRLVHLLEHTTGWPDIGPRVLAKNERTWSGFDGIKFSSPGFVSKWKPGYFTNYNNAGPGVAGYILEKVTGAIFEQYARDTILRPMGMAIADFDLTPEIEATLAKSYGSDGAVTPYQHIVLKPAGSLNASAREMAQLVKLYLGRGTVNDHQILSAQSVDRIERSESNLGSKSGFTYAYGLGNVAFPDKGVAFRGHNGSIDSFTSVLGYSQRSDAGYILMANGGEGVDFAKPAASLIQSFLARNVAFQPTPTVPMQMADLQKFAGFYDSITPPNNLLRPYGLFLNIKYVSVEGDHLVINGRKYIPVGQNSFRHIDRELPAINFVEEYGHIYKMGAFSAEEKRAFWQMLPKFAAVIVAVFGTMFGLVMIVPWTIAAIHGRLSERGGIYVRLIPFAGLVAFWLNLALPLAAIVGSDETGILRLADIGPYSLTIFACGLIYTFCAVFGTWLAMTRREASALIRTYAVLVSVMLLCAAGYAAGIGWLPMLIWTM